VNAFLVHYARGEPFRSITGLPPEQRAETVAQLNEQNAWGLSRFADPDYLERRSRVERLLRAQFVARGGRPTLETPLYCFLGRHARFEAHPRNRAYAIALDALAPEQVSFTYGDSLLAFDGGYRAQAGDAYLDPRCGAVFLREELESLKGRLVIEAQLWVAPPVELVCCLGSVMPPFSPQT
jgi:hypothetical protein